MYNYKAKNKGIMIPNITKNIVFIGKITFLYKLSSQSISVLAELNLSPEISLHFIYSTEVYIIPI